MSTNFMKRSGVSSLNLSSLSLSSSQSSSSSSLASNSSHHNAPTTNGTGTNTPRLSRGFGSMQSRQAEMDLTSLLAAAPVTPKSTMIMATTPRGSLPQFDDMDVDGTSNNGCSGGDNWGYFVDTPDF